MLPKADGEIQVWLNCGFLFISYNSTSNPKPLLLNSREKDDDFLFCNFNFYEIGWMKRFFAIEGKIFSLAIIPVLYSKGLALNEVQVQLHTISSRLMSNITIRKTRLNSGKKCWHFYGKLLHLHFRQANQFNSQGWIRQFNDSNGD